MLPQSVTNTRQITVEIRHLHSNDEFRRMNEDDARSLLRDCLATDSFHFEDKTGRGLNINTFFPHCKAIGSNVILIENL